MSKRHCRLKTKCNFYCVVVVLENNARRPERSSHVLVHIKTSGILFAVDKKPSVCLIYPIQRHWRFLNYCRNHVKWLMPKLYQWFIKITKFHHKFHIYVINTCLCTFAYFLSSNIGPIFLIFNGILCVLKAFRVVQMDRQFLVLFCW